MKKTKVKVSFLLRLKFAYKAFRMKNYNHYFTYRYHCKLIPDAGVCDNNRRSSGCTNEAEICLMNPFFKIKLEETEHCYHVCTSCAEKYIDTDGEDSVIGTATGS